MKDTDIVDLTCTINKKTHKLECTSKNAIPKISAAEIIEYDLPFTAVVGSEPKIRETTQQKPPAAISIIVAITLVSGFGFAVAYLLLYMAYDWISNKPIDYNPGRVAIAFLIIGGILVLLVTASYFMIRNSQKSQIRPRIIRHENMPGPDLDR